MEQLLTDICRIQYGYPFDSAKFSESDGIPLVRIRDVGRGFSETKTIERFPEQYTVYDGDILIGMDGEFNIAKWNGGNAALNQRVCKLIPEKVNKDYIFYFMPVALKAIEAKTPFVTVKHLSAKELNKIVVPLPDIEKQKAIASTLSKVDRFISLRKQQLAKLDELIRSQFIEMFGDPVTNSQERQQVPFSTFMRGIRYGTSQPPEFADDGQYKFIRATNIKNGRITEADMLHISAEEASKIEKCKLEGNEIIIVRSGANTGDTCVVTSDYAGQYAGYDIIVTLDLERANPVFFNELINTDYMTLVVKPLTARTAQPHINTQQVSNLPMLVATLDEQNEFASFVEQSDKSKAVVQQSLDKLETLKKALMQQYFG